MKQPAERSIPPRHRISVTWVGLVPARRQLRDTTFCGLCARLALKSRENARGYIALILRSPDFVGRADDYSFAPYRCPHLAGMWHVGHNRKLAELLKGKR